MMVWMSPVSGPVDWMWYVARVRARARARARVRVRVRVGLDGLDALRGEQVRERVDDAHLG